MIYLIIYLVGFFISALISDDENVPLQTMFSVFWPVILIVQLCFLPLYIVELINKLKDTVIHFFKKNKL